MPLHTEIVCSLCGCLCDDLVVEAHNDRIVRTENACSQAKSVFENLSSFTPPVASLKNVACEIDDALEAAAKTLRNSRAPLIFGLSAATTEGQRAAIELADQIGAGIDTAGAHITRAATLAMQQVGLSTCTLGEVKQRADLVIYWGADPLQTHPRHLERYSALPVSEFLPNGRQDRTLITIHHQETLTEKEADKSFRIAAGRDFEVITALRQLIRDEETQLDSDCGLELESLRSLARQLKSCRYGAIFFGSGLTQGPSANLTIEILYRLVSELNAWTRFTARAMGQPGAENILTWQTGFPLAVDLQQRFPRYQPGEFSAEELLEQKAVDSCVIVDSGCLEQFSPAAIESLRTLPTIVLDPPQQQCLLQSTVHFTTLVPGIHVAGTMYRMDDVALPLRKLCNSTYLATEEILDGIKSRLT